MEDIQVLILQWTKLDKELKLLNQKSSLIRKQKETLQSKLSPLIQEHNLQESVFSLPSLQTNVTFKEQIVPEALSYKFLEDKFNDYFDNPEECLELLKYVKEHRNKKSSFVLKSSEINIEVQ